MKTSNSNRWVITFLAIILNISVEAAQPIYTLYAFTNFAGMPGGFGTVDGTGGAARFAFSSFGSASRSVYGPVEIASDADGNLYVADSDNHTIRKITRTGEVTTIAGSPRVSGFNDGHGSAARFNYPTGVALDHSGNLYVTDTRNHGIRKVTRDGLVTTFVGNASITNEWGYPVGDYSDGIRAAARFNFPTGIVIDREDNLYVADTFNNVIRKITVDGVVTTLAGQPSIENLGAGYADGPAMDALFRVPRGLALDALGNLYVADSGNHSIRKVSPAGDVSTLAGNAANTNQWGMPVGGDMDGTGTAAQFNGPHGVAVDAFGNVYVADTANEAIRKVTPDGTVTTLKRFDEPNEDGEFSQHRPTAIAMDSAGNLTVVSSSDSLIVNLTLAGAIRTIAGSSSHVGSADGTGNAARFNGPRGLAIDVAGNVYVADTGNHKLRKITPAGAVTTMAETANDAVAVDHSGNIYAGAGDTFRSIKKITPAGKVTTIASGFGNSKYGSPLGLGVDSSDNVYVADTLNHTIRKVTSAGMVTTLAGKAPTAGEDPSEVGGYADGTGSEARFNFPQGLAVDSRGNIYVADSGNHAIRKVTPEGVVTTVAGDASLTNQFGERIGGYADGVGSKAYFNFPLAVAVDNTGNLYVADEGNNMIRKITPEGKVTTLGGATNVIGGDDGIGIRAQFSSPFAVAVGADGQLYVADIGNNRVTKGAPIMIPAPRFITVSSTNRMLIASLSEIVSGVALVIESSDDLRYWRPLETSVGSGTRLPIELPITTNTGSVFLRALVK